MEIDVFLALTGAGVSEAQARATAEAFRKEITEEVRTAQKNVATREDVKTIESSLRLEIANLKADFFQRLSDMQRSTVAVMCGGVSVIAVLVTVLKFVG
ncbi:hypothetical protein [Roseateles sp. MS654]|uniref:hypothetical protein n=1 Tax=Roseateles sp. MS654 TaxID=3412685 RepID=UPI003C2B0E40